MTNVLNPPDKNQLAQGRRLMRPGSNGSGKPQGIKLGRLMESKPQGIKLGGLMESKPQPQISQLASPEVSSGSEVPPTVPTTPTEAPSLPPEDGMTSGTPQGQTVASPEMGQLTEEAATVPVLDNREAGLDGKGQPGQNNLSAPQDIVPTIRPGDYRSPNTIDVPSIIQSSQIGEALSGDATINPQYDQMRQRYEPENLINIYKQLPVSTIQYAGTYEVDTDKIRSNADALKREQDRIVRENKVGSQNFNQDATQEGSTKTTAMQAALAASGVISTVGKARQDATDPNREKNTVQRIWDWITDSDTWKGGADAIGGTAAYVGGKIAAGVTDVLAMGAEDGSEAEERLKRQARNISKHADYVKDQTYGRVAQNEQMQNLYKVGTGILAEGAEDGSYAEQYWKQEASGQDKGLKLEPLMPDYGDYGKIPLVSGLAYFLSIPQNILMGGIADVTDALGITGKSYNERTGKWERVKQQERIWNALSTGQDLGLLNRNSPDAPFGLQEPEDFKDGTVIRAYKSGELTQNDPKWKDHPLGKFWDAPEWFEETTIGKVLPGDAKTNHIIQAGLVFILDSILGGFADAGTNILKKGAVHATNKIFKKGTQEAVEQVTQEAAQQGTRQVTKPKPDNTIKVEKPKNTPTKTPDNLQTPDKVSPDVIPPRQEKGKITVTSSSGVETSTREIKPVTVEIPVVKPQQLDIEDGAVLDIKDIPSGYRLSERVQLDTKLETPLSNADLELVLRNNEELSELAYITKDPITGKSLNPNNEILTDGELAALNQRYGNIFDRYGKPIPDVANTKYIDVNGEILEVDPALRPLGKSDLEDFENITPSPVLVETLKNKVDSLSRALSKVITNQEGGADRILDKLRDTQNVLSRVLSRQGDDLVYVQSFKELPSTLVSTSDEAIEYGTSFVVTGNKLDAQRPVLDQLIDEVDTLKDVVDNSAKDLDALDPNNVFRRESTFNSLSNKESYTGVPVDELHLKPYQSKLISPVEELPDRTIGVSPVLDEGRVYLHGSSSPVPLRERDVLSGGTPSEFGLGTYLTNRQDVADAAANAMPQLTRPPRPDSVDSIPYRVTVSTDKLTKGYDLNQPLPKEGRDIFRQAASDTISPEFARVAYSDDVVKGLKGEAYWTRFNKVADQMGYKISPLIEREFQQKVLLGLQNKNVDHVLHVAKDGTQTVVVTMPHKLSPVGKNIPLETPSITKQLESRAYLDNITAKTVNNGTDEVLLSRAAQTKLGYHANLLTDVAEVTVKEYKKQAEYFEELIKSEVALERQIMKENAEKVGLLETPLPEENLISQGTTPSVVRVPRQGKGLEGVNTPAQDVVVRTKLEDLTKNSILSLDKPFNTLFDRNITKVFKEVSDVVRKPVKVAGTTNLKDSLSGARRALESQIIRDASRSDGVLIIDSLKDLSDEVLAKNFPVGTRVSVVTPSGHSLVLLAGKTDLKPNNLKVFQFKNGVTQWDEIVSTNGRVSYRRTNLKTGEIEAVRINKDGQVLRITSKNTLDNLKDAPLAKVPSNVTNRVLYDWEVSDVSVNKFLDDISSMNTVKDASDLSVPNKYLKDGDVVLGNRAGVSIVQRGNKIVSIDKGGLVRELPANQTKNINNTLSKEPSLDLCL